jgi:hypothetical protein
MINHLRPVSMTCPSASAAQSPRTDPAPAFHVVPTGEDGCRHVEEPTRRGFSGRSEIPPPPPAA